jgi:hypothetical protein
MDCSRYCLHIYLEGLKKTTKGQRPDIRCTIRYSNRAPRDKFRGLPLSYEMVVQYFIPTICLALSPLVYVLGFPAEGSLSLVRLVTPPGHNIAVTTRDLLSVWSPIAQAVSRRLHSGSLVKSHVSCYWLKYGQ